MKTSTTRAQSPFGRELRRWRTLRGVSQLRLANEAAMSPRYLSFVETGRSRPSQAVVLRLADALDVPLRERNRLLEAAGLPATYGERALDDEELAPYRTIVRMLLDKHEPYPGVVLDRGYRVVEANDAARAMLPGVEGVDWLEASLAEGSPMRQAVENFDEVAYASLDLLRREAASGAPVHDLIAKVERHLAGIKRPRVEPSPVLTARLRVGDTVVSTVSTIVRFSSVRDATLDELRVELFFPADDASARFFEELAERRGTKLTGPRDPSA